MLAWFVERLNERAVSGRFVPPYGFSARSM